MSNQRRVKRRVTARAFADAEPIRFAMGPDPSDAEVVDATVVDVHVACRHCAQRYVVRMPNLLRCACCGTIERGKFRCDHCAKDISLDDGPNVEAMPV